MNRTLGSERTISVKAFGLFAGLYAAQAITGSLVQTGLPTVLRDGGVPLDRLGLLALLFLPWALKFLWAPIVDRYCVKRLGRRRSWLLICQSLIALSFFAMAWLSPFSHFEALLLLLLAVAFFASTQDIATDALAVEAIEEEQRGMVSGASVFGGYFGFLLGVGAWLPAYAAFGWRASMFFMAALVVILTVPALFARSLENRDLPRTARRHAGLARAVANPSIRRGMLFLVVYQAGLRLGMALIGPYLVDTGLSLDAIGWLKGTGGALIGLFAAAVIMTVVRKPGMKALVAAALTNGLAFAGLAAASLDWAPSSVIVPLILFQSAAAAFSMITLYATMIGWCSSEQAGTDFALLQSADAVLAIGFSVAAGFVGQSFGHPVNFGCAALLLLAAAAFVTRLFPASLSADVPAGSLELQGKNS